jgi:hypothetical protein
VDPFPVKSTGTQTARGRKMRSLGMTTVKLGHPACATACQVYPGEGAGDVI